MASGWTFANINPQHGRRWCQTRILNSNAGGDGGSRVVGGSHIGKPTAIGEGEGYGLLALSGGIGTGSNSDSGGGVAGWDSDSASGVGRRVSGGGVCCAIIGGVVARIAISSQRCIAGEGILHHDSRFAGFTEGNGDFSRVALVNAGGERRRGSQRHRGDDWGAEILDGGDFAVILTIHICTGSRDDTEGKRLIPLVKVKVLEGGDSDDFLHLTRGEGDAGCDWRIIHPSRSVITPILRPGGIGNRDLTAGWTGEADEETHWVALKHAETATSGHRQKRIGDGGVRGGIVDNRQCRGWCTRRCIHRVADGEDDGLLPLTHHCIAGYGHIDVHKTLPGWDSGGASGGVIVIAIAFGSIATLVCVFGGVVYGDIIEGLATSQRDSKGGVLALIYRLGGAGARDGNGWVGCDVLDGGGGGLPIQVSIQRRIDGVL